MQSNKKRAKKIRELPIEEQITAPWANIQRRKPITGVSVPSDFDVELAREWVNQNQK